MVYRYIFQVNVRPGEERAFELSWHNGSIPIQKMPGARGTRLHKKEGMKSIYIAIAEWDSKEARHAAMSALADPTHVLGNEMRKWGSNEDFGKVTLIAEIDEIFHIVPNTTPPILEGDGYAGIRRLLNMKANAFFAEYAIELGDIVVRALSERPADYRGSSKLGRRVSPYLLRHFLEDFPDKKSLKKIFGIGAMSADRFGLLCARLGLPFNS